MSAQAGAPAPANSYVFFFCKDTSITPETIRAAPRICQPPRVSPRKIAARMAAKTPGAAAIASSQAAIAYNLNSLASNIQDAAHNITRFLVIGTDKVRPTGKDKTSLLFATPHIPGALHSVIKPIAESGLNMVKLESRPSKSASWHYLFFVDLEGHEQDDNVHEALKEIDGYCSFMKRLGSYPAGGDPWD